MPEVIRRRIIDQLNGPGSPRITVPQRVAQALDPAGTTRRHIPDRVTLHGSGVPFMGELREDAGSSSKSGLVVGDQISLGILRRPWNYVGYMVDPGDASAGGTGLFARLYVYTEEMRAPLANVAIPLGGGPIAFAPMILGARAELVVLNSTAATVSKLRGAIWGMSER